MSFSSIVTWPFSWLLLTLYELVKNYGLAIFLFALVVKLLLLPFQMKSKRSTMRTSRLNPIMKELEKKHGDDKRKYQEEVAKLYKEEGINPMSGCIWTLIPFPILIALYSVIRQPLTSLMRIGADALERVKDVIISLGMTVPAGGYGELEMVNIINKNPAAFQGISNKLVNLDFSFLGMNLSQVPSYNVFKFDWSDPAVWGVSVGLFMIPVISALTSYLAMKVSMAGNPQQAEMQQGSMKTMNMIMPLMSIFICFTMPAALGIYWIFNSVLGMAQDCLLNRHFNKILDAEDAERRERMRAREAELESKRLETERLKAEGATERNKNTSKKKLQTAEKTQNEERVAAEKAAEKAERKAALGISDDKPASQVGTRKFARGRAYVEERFQVESGEEPAVEDAPESEQE